MESNRYVITNPEVMLGKPVIRGTRITVELIVRKLSEGYEIDDLLKSYPHIKKRHILAALKYAADRIAHDGAHPAS